MRLLVAIPFLLLAFQSPPPGSTQICVFKIPNGGIMTGTCPVAAITEGLPLTAKDANGTLIFQAGTAVVCPSAALGPGAAGPQVVCPAGLYLPLQLVSVTNGVTTVASNSSIDGTGSVAPFAVRSPPTNATGPRMAPGYTVASSQWVNR